MGCHGVFALCFHRVNSRCSTGRAAPYRRHSGSERLQMFADCSETQVQNAPTLRERVRAHDRTFAQGWGLKAESALCVGDDCSLAFTWEKGDYVTSLYR